MRHSWRSGFEDECRSQYRDALACAAMNKALDSYLDYCNNRRRHRSLA